MKPSGRLVFIGECRSLTAQRKGWTWKDGRLAAKPLFEVGFRHIALVHPAARGRIRKRERYHAHVKERLAPALRRRR